MAHHYQLGWLLCVAGAISHTTAGSDYQLITAVSCRRYGTFHCCLSQLDQILTRLVQAT